MELPAVLEKKSNQDILLGKEKNSIKKTWELFRSFHQVFSAIYLVERVVFWVEEKKGKAIVRLVRDLARKSKADDFVVGMTFYDHDAIRIMIGNHVAGCSMTNVKWEIYNDYGLTEMAAFGRFDHFDLLRNVNESKAAWLGGRGIMPSGWDFDNILLMHLCSNCGGARNKNFLIYNPNIACDNCGAVSSLAESTEVIREIVKRYGLKIMKIKTHRQEELSDDRLIQLFLDPSVNSLPYWLVLYDRIQMIDKAFAFGSFQNKINIGYYDTALAMFRESLFYCFKFEFLVQKIEKVLKKVGFEEGYLELPAAIMGKYAEIMENGFPLKSRQLEEAKIRTATNEYIEMGLPLIINEIIVKTGSWLEKNYSVENLLLALKEA